VGLDSGVGVDADLRRRCWTLSGILGHLVVSKLTYNERLRWLRSNGPLNSSAELMWHLLPPRTFATDKAVVTALLEPHARVAGDAYDYAANGDDIYLAVFDGLGHDLQAGQTTALAITAVRQARRDGVFDLAELAARADDLIAAQPGTMKFVTAVLATLDTVTGVLQYVLAGHPPPLLVRHGRAVQEFPHLPRLPLGIRGSPIDRLGVGREQLEPGDRLLLYTDGITEARDSDDRFFGERRLVDLVERMELDRVSAPETLRRLGAAVLAHQDGHLQDDASLIMVDWSSQAQRRMCPTLD
jgi:serine phosphatase RsbU (regulator of sigma subunit)